MLNLKKKNNKSHLIIGLVYSEMCIHCIHLKPKWAKMKDNIKKKVKKGKYTSPEYVEIEHSNIQKLEEFNNTHNMNGEKVIINGYPTAFKLENGKLEYYIGNREEKEMEDWFMHNSHKKSKQTKKIKRSHRKTIKNRM